jgi:hypothetical protein
MDQLSLPFGIEQTIIGSCRDLRLPIVAMMRLQLALEEWEQSGVQQFKGLAYSFVIASGH